MFLFFSVVDSCMVSVHSFAGHTGGTVNHILGTIRSVFPLFGPQECTVPCVFTLSQSCT